MVRNYKATGKPRGRPAGHRRWTHYPVSFMRVIEHFLTSRETLVIPLPREQLYTYRTQFYRFFKAVREEYELTESDVDKAASGLTDAFNVANNILISSSEMPPQLVFIMGELADPIAADSLDRRLAADAFATKAKPLVEEEIARKQTAIDNKALRGIKTETTTVEDIPDWMKKTP